MRQISSTKTNARTTSVALLLAMTLIAACRADDGVAPRPKPSESTEPTPPPALRATIRGIVVASVTGDPVVGARVSVGTVATSTGSDGSFELTDLPAGQRLLLQCTAPGFAATSTEIELPHGVSTRIIALARAEELANVRLSGFMTPGYQSLTIGGVLNGVHHPVTDASVSLNGVALTQQWAGVFTSSLALVPGSEVRLMAIVGSDTVQAVGFVPEPPVITSPVQGDVVAWSDALTIRWAAANDPDLFTVCVNCWANALDGAVWTVPGAARTHTVASRILSDWGSGTPIRVTAVSLDFLAFSEGRYSGSVSFSAPADVLVTVKY